jgi:hypothetical protein
MMITIRHVGNLLHARNTVAGLTVATCAPATFERLFTVVHVQLNMAKSMHPLFTESDGFVHTHEMDMLLGSCHRGYGKPRSVGHVLKGAADAYEMELKDRVLAAMDKDLEEHGRPLLHLLPSSAEEKEDLDAIRAFLG